VRVSNVAGKFVPVKYEIYGDLKRSSDEFEYRFTSVGPKGEIPILVQFVQRDDPHEFNLAFGVILEEDNLDDNARINNGDRDKILASVVAAIYSFTAECPDKVVYFMGSTEARTRLYRMTIALNLDELIEKFDILGGLFDSHFYWEKFKPNRPYLAFAIKRKNNNLHI
jgi:hypothetical protein